MVMGKFVTNLIKKHHGLKCFSLLQCFIEHHDFFLRLSWRCAVIKKAKLPIP